MVGAQRAYGFKSTATGGRLFRGLRLEFLNCKIKYSIEIFHLPLRPDSVQERQEFTAFQRTENDSRSIQ